MSRRYNVPYRRPSPVVVRRPDGTSEEVAAYSRSELKEIVTKKVPPSPKPLSSKG
jgi:hypothetical protein